MPNGSYIGGNYYEDEANAKARRVVAKLRELDVDFADLADVKKTVWWCDLSQTVHNSRLEQQCGVTHKSTRGDKELCREMLLVPLVYAEREAAK